MQYLDGRHFGAVGDGVHDDTAAIRAGLRAADAVGGRLWLPTPPVGYRLAGGDLAIHDVYIGPEPPAGADVLDSRPAPRPQLAPSGAEGA